MYRININYNDEEKIYPNYLFLHNIKKNLYKFIFF